MCQFVATQCPRENAMHAAHDQTLLIDGLLITIIVAYLGIAYQFWTRRRAATGRATTALGQLVIIFVFCALCGYLPRLIEVPQAVLLVAHAVLAASAWAYMLSGQVDRLSIAVDYADSHTSREQRIEDALEAEAEACARIAEQAGARVAAGQIRERHARRKEASAPGAIAEGA
jgi:hypothetical protein